jgi:hypothetical protein
MSFLGKSGNFWCLQNWSKLGVSWPVCLLDKRIYVNVACEKFHKVSADSFSRLSPIVACNRDN